MISVTENTNIDILSGWKLISVTNLHCKFSQKGVLMLIIIHHKFSLNRHLRRFLLRLSLPRRKNFATGLWKERLQDEYKKDDVLHGQISPEHTETTISDPTENDGFGANV